MASIRLCSLAMPLPAMSKAVPWSTEVRMIGRPSVMLTPESVVQRAGRRIDLEAEQLDRDVPLVVVHGDHGVVLAGAQLDEDGVAGHRADHVEAVGDRFGDRRRGDVDVLPAEQPAFARMRVERRDGDRRRGMPSRQRLVGEVDDAAQPLRRQPLRHVLQRDMGGDVADAHVAVREHHHRPAHAGEIGQHLGMAGIVVAGLVERLLVERRGDDGADPAGLGEAHALLDGQVGEASAIGGEHARMDRLAFRPGLQAAESRPIGIVGLDLAGWRGRRRTAPAPARSARCCR